MKYIRLIYILIIPICILFNACENDQNGFTNKAEAKNELINGLKEGKWVEYNIVDTQGVKNGVHHFGDTLSYDLEIYQVGQLNGISNRFDRSGKLRSQVTYVNGKKNG
ncbi:MAG TPA: hypothetical protein VK890_11785, partial [Bacteroidia bacterium]|nr:hypothetical protein [Bacteroidia bacterium]